jgi:hypothetical protein
MGEDEDVAVDGGGQAGAVDLGGWKTWSPSVRMTTGPCSRRAARVARASG